MSLSQALEHVKSRRQQASPNAGFILQLEDYEKSLRGALLYTFFLSNPYLFYSLSA